MNYVGEQIIEFKIPNYKLRQSYNYWYHKLSYNWHFFKSYEIQEVLYHNLLSIKIRKVDKNYLGLEI